MELINVTVNRAEAKAEGETTVPARAVGAKIRFCYGPEWEGLIKTVVMKGCTTVSLTDAEDVVNIPAEVIQEPGVRLLVGVCGIDAEKTVVIPTVWADLGRVRSSASPEGQEANDPEMPIWAQLMRRMKVLERSLGDSLEPAQEDIPKVFFGGALPQTKEDTVMSFRYVSKTMEISGYCKTKAQGSSSMGYPKKNQTVKLYKDEACTEKLMVDFRGWGEQHKFCFKANWVDLTHARNVVCARLWGDMVRAREDFAQLPEQLRTSPNLGAVDGFPVKVYANGIYQGRYTLNIPKDAWMANLNENLEHHCLLCGESNEDNRSLFRSLSAIDGNDWKDEMHDTVPASILTRWNAAIDFIVNSDDVTFRDGIGEYFDVMSLVDYYCMGLAFCHWDGFGKNQTYFTYDGKKWYANAYDLDNTFGNCYGSSFLTFNFPRSSYDDFQKGQGNLLYIRIAELFAEEIRERYLQLRKGVLSEDHIIDRFERFTDICPGELTAEDYAATTAEGAFSGIPGQGSNHIQQIRDFLVKRLGYVDNLILEISKPMYAFENGTRTFTNNGVVLTVSEGNHIHYSCTSFPSDSTVNVSNVSLNSDVTSDGWGNCAFKPKVFSLKAGDSVRIVINGRNVHYGLWYLFKAGASDTITLYEGEPGNNRVENTVTISEDFDVGAVAVYGSALDTQHDLEIYVNEVRYV